LTSIGKSASFVQKCTYCGSKLVLVSEKTAKLDNYASLVTTKIYKCSNKECQSDIDKKTTGRITLQKQQEKAKKTRIEAKKGMRLNKKTISR
jgi:DNA-directed RNA polymerase subunit RPC12/RpoP